MVKYPIGRPSIDHRETSAVSETMTRGRLTQGELVEKFEARFAERLGVNFAVACSSGTAALHLALAALGIGPGDEVLVPDLTYVATANAVRYTGATPVLCDVDPASWGIDLGEAERHLSPKTKAILPVHLYGVPNDMDRLMKFASTFNLLVIEDAAEGLGGFSEHKQLGTFGHASAFSFYANKIVTTGEGGMVTTDDGQVAKYLRLLRGQGVDLSIGRYWHGVLGFNYRMTELQAAIGLVQMEKFSEMLAERVRVIQQYRYELRHAGFKFPRHSGIAPWLFTALTGDCDRDSLAEELLNAGIETRPMFTPLHRLPMYHQESDTFVVSDVLSDSGLSFPTYPALSNADVRMITAATLRAVEGLRD